MFITVQEMALSHVVPLIKRNGWVINNSAQEKTRGNADERTACKIDKRGSVKKGGPTGQVQVLAFLSSGKNTHLGGTPRFKFCLGHMKVVHTWFPRGKNVNNKHEYTTIKLRSEQGVAESQDYSRNAAGAVQVSFSFSCPEFPEPHSLDCQRSSASRLDSSSSSS